LLWQQYWARLGLSHAAHSGEEGFPAVETGAPPHAVLLFWMFRQNGQRFLMPVPEHESFLYWNVTSSFLFKWLWSWPEY
jgi:hypothetical protein